MQIKAQIKNDNYTLLFEIPCDISLEVLVIRIVTAEQKQSAQQARSFAFALHIALEAARLPISSFSPALRLMTHQRFYNFAYVRRFLVLVRFKNRPDVLNLTDVTLLKLFILGLSWSVDIIQSRFQEYLSSKYNEQININHIYK